MVQTSAHSHGACATLTNFSHFLSNQYLFKRLRELKAAPLCSTFFFVIRGLKTPNRSRGNGCFSPILSLMELCVFNA